MLGHSELMRLQIGGMLETDLAVRQEGITHSIQDPSKRLASKPIAVSAILGHCGSMSLIIVLQFPQAWAQIDACDQDVLVCKKGQEFVGVAGGPKFYRHRSLFSFQEILI